MLLDLHKYVAHPLRYRPLTPSSASWYFSEVALSAGVAKLAYAADSKTEFCFFCPLRNSSQLLETKQENAADALTPLAGIFEHFQAF